MQSKIFGPTNKRVFRVGLGTYGHGEAYGGITKKESLKILHTAAEYATNEAGLLIDTAPRYGNGLVETWIGDFLKKYKKDNILIATKGGRHIEPGRINEKDFSEEFIKNDIENSLKRLKVDSVFLYQLHNPSLSTIQDGSVFTVLEEMRKQGKIQWYGVSIDTAEEGLAVIDVCHRKEYKGLASLQIIYNILQKKVLDDLFEITNRYGVAIIAREPLLRGFLTDSYVKGIEQAKLPSAPKKMVEFYGKDEIMSRVGIIQQFLNSQNCTAPMAEVALKFVLANSAITTVIPGINQKAYIEADLLTSENDIEQGIVQRLNSLNDLKRVGS